MWTIKCQKNKLQCLCKFMVMTLPYEKIEGNPVSANMIINAAFKALRRGAKAYHDRQFQKCHCHVIIKELNLILINSSNAKIMNQISWVWETHYVCVCFFCVWFAKHLGTILYICLLKNISCISNVHVYIYILDIHLAKSIQTQWPQVSLARKGIAVGSGNSREKGWV